MTQNEKAKIVDQIFDLLCLLISEKENTEDKADMELLTVKECSNAVKGLSERTIRQLVAEDKIAHIRVGKGNGSKILISKETLFNYVNGA